MRRHGPEHCAFCTDDREPDTLVREGHLDAMCRQAVAEGVAAEDALLMATLHPARYHGLRDLGAIAPGYRADLVVLEDVEGFRAAHGGRRRAGGGARRGRAAVRGAGGARVGARAPCGSRRRRRTPSTSARPPSACG